MSRQRPPTTTVRLGPELHNRLMDAATERGLSANYIVIAALNDFLPRLIPADELKLTKEVRP